MKPKTNKLQANSTGALKSGGKNRDDDPGKKVGPIDRGQKDVKQRGPMRKGR